MNSIQLLSCGAKEINLPQSTAGSVYAQLSYSSLDNYHFCSMFKNSFERSDLEKGCSLQNYGRSKKRNCVFASNCISDAINS